MLKPEALKLKSVSELDARLGYHAEDVGQLVFRKPDAYVAWEQGGLDAVHEYIVNQGFPYGTADYNNALNRVVQRTNEWRKFEKSYKKYDTQGFVDVTFNLSGNGVSDNVATAVQDLRGFRLGPIPGETESYVIKLKNDAGQWVSVTGDIDPIAFTHLDGSPLSEVGARLLLKECRPTRCCGRARRVGDVHQGRNGVHREPVQAGRTGHFSSHRAAEPHVSAKFRADKSRGKARYDYNLHWRAASTMPERR